MKREKVVSAFLGIALMVSAAVPSVLFAEQYTLGDLYRIALARSERVKLSEEDITIARLGKNKSLSFLLPNLSAFNNYTKYTETKRSDSGSVVQPSYSDQWGLQVSQTFSLGGKEFTALSISGDVVEKSRYDLIQVRQAYLLTLSFAFYDVLKSARALAIADANLERLTKYRDAAQTRLKVGEATKTALLRAEGELSGARADRIKAENALGSAKVVLARIAGITGDFSLKEDQSEETTPSLAGLQEAALARRPELKGFEVLRKIAEKQVRFAKGSYWPDLSLEAAYKRNEQEPPNSNFNRESIYGGVNLNFPLYEGGFRKADVRQAEARQRQSELFYADALKSVRLEVENAYLDYLTLLGTIKFLRDQLVYAQDNYNAVSKQYEFGLANSLDVIDANNLLLASQRQLADATYNAALSHLTLKRVSGTLLEGGLDGGKGQAGGEGVQVRPVGQ